jgi:hypothetical protein
LRRGHGRSRICPLRWNCGAIPPSRRSLIPAANSPRPKSERGSAPRSSRRGPGGVQYWALFDHRNGEFVGCGGLRPWLHTPGEANFEVGFHLVKRCCGTTLRKSAVLGPCREADIQADNRPREIENGRDESRRGVFRCLVVAARDLRRPNANARPPHSKTTVDGSGTAVSCRFDMVLVYAIRARPFRRGDAFRGSRNWREKTAGKPGPSFDD